AGRVLDQPLLRRRARGRIMWPDRHFSVAAGDVEDIARLAQPRDAPAPRTDKPLSLLDAKAETGGAAGKIRMMQVVGLNPQRDEPAEQRFEHGGIVVYAVQEHTL